MRWRRNQKNVQNRGRARGGCASCVTAAGPRGRRRPQVDPIHVGMEGALPLHCEANPFGPCLVLVVANVEWGTALIPHYGHAPAPHGCSARQPHISTAKLIFDIKQNLQNQSLRMNHKLATADAQPSKCRQSVQKGETTPECSLPHQPSRATAAATAPPQE